MWCTFWKISFLSKGQIFINVIKDGTANKPVICVNKTLLSKIFLRISWMKISFEHNLLTLCFVKTSTNISGVNFGSVIIFVPLWRRGNVAAFNPKIWKKGTIRGNTSWKSAGNKWSILLTRGSMPWLNLNDLI